MTARDSYTSLGVYAGSDATVRCSTYPHEGPILAVDTRRVSVNLAVAGRKDTPAWAVQFARQLAEQAQVFAAECERLHAAQHGGGNGQGADAKDAAA